MGPKRHSVEIQKFTLTLFFTKKIRESNVFLKEVTKELISRKSYLGRVNFSFFHTVARLSSPFFSPVKCCIFFLFFQLREEIIPEHLEKKNYKEYVVEWFAMNGTE